MKKLLNISVIAALAVLPVAANAAVGEVVSVADPAHSTASGITAETAPKYALAVEAATDATNVATASYVKGAYNAAIKAINKVSETATNALTADGTATLTNKAIDADSNTITNIEVADMKGTAVVNSTEGIQATASASDDALVTEKAVAATLDNYAKKTGVTQTITNSTIAGTVPTVTVWGVETPGTAQITASITGATYAEPANP